MICMMVHPLAASVVQPFVKPYRQADYQNAHAQNWAVAQDSRGVLYFGNTSGVLELDGEGWRLIPVANQSIVRSLAADQDGRVWVGAVGEIGYLEANELGELEYVSLLQYLPEGKEFTDVWRTHVIEDVVYFSAYKHLLWWQDGTVKSLELPGLHNLMHPVGDKLYGVEEEHGLVIFKENEVYPVAGGQPVEKLKVFFLLPYDDDRLLIGTIDQGLFLFELPRSEQAGAAEAEGRLSKLPTRADDILKSHRLYSGAALPDGKFALGTMNGGAVIISRSGELIHHIDRSSGLPDQSVWGIFCDQQQGLWLALNKGLARVELGSPILPVVESSGIEGTVEAVVRHQGTLFTATSAGLFALKGDRFSRLEEAQSPCWSFELVHGLEGNPDQLMAGCYRGAHLVQPDGRCRLVSTEFANCFLLYQSRQYPRIVFGGVFNGVRLIRLEDGQWSEIGRIAGVVDEVRSIAEDADGALWLGTHFDGVLRVELDPEDLTRPRSLQHFGLEQGLPSLKSVKIFPTRYGLLFATQEGLYQLEDGNSFVPSNLLGPAAQELRILRLVPDATGGFWISTFDDRQLHARHLESGGFELIETGLQRLQNVATYSFWPEADGTTWIGTTEGLFLYDPQLESESHQRFSTLIRDVTIRGGSPLFRGTRVLGEPPVLPYEQGSMAFTFAATDYDAPGSTLYSYRLDGFDAEWSAWMPDTKTEYTNLHEGRYCFRVRARNVYGTISDEAGFSFVVEPPWQRTLPAYLGFVVLLGLLMVGAIRLRSLKLVRERDRLNQIVTERTEQLSRHTERLKEAHAELESFSYSVSHDLQAPLRKLNGLLSLLFRDEKHFDERDRHLVERIIANTRQMSELIDALLELSRTTRAQLEPEPVDLSQLAQEIVETLRAGDPDREVRVEANPDLTVVADRKLIRIALQNLLENAWKFTRTRDHAVIEIGCDGTGQADSGRQVFYVRDNGVGFDARFADKLFAPFQRLHSDSEYPGSGVGLATVYRIIRRHGGTIWADSQPDQGATFYFAISSSVGPEM
jgi:signal transduction histidine kinase/ligand-binding sensor domain-containing protein